MKYAKRILPALFALAMAIGMVSCGDDSSSAPAGSSSAAQAASSDVALTDATGKYFTVGVADGWKLVTAEEAGSMMEADFVVKGTAFEATGTYLQISQTTGNIDDWAAQIKNDTYIKYDGEYTYNGIKWYCADKVAGADIDGKIVTVYPQNGADLKDAAVQAMLGSIRWASGS
ncbi:MAG: hypothetical protein IJ060_09490 [Oscillospiraceae bacterium]|nr:hypothetical protein [Oscillospiraceae bacterium]